MMAQDKRELTPEQRTMRAKMAAYAMHAKHDRHETTRAAHKAAHETRFEREVDPDGILDPAERARRAQAARTAYMRGLALKRSRLAQARREGKMRESA